MRQRLIWIASELPDAHFGYVSGFTNFDRYSIEWVVTGTIGGYPYVRHAASIGVFDGWGRIVHNRDYGADLRALAGGERPSRTEVPA